MSPLALHHALAFSILIVRFSSLSALFPNKINGKLSGFLGAACLRNSDFQFERDVKDLEFVISYTNKQHSAPL